MDFAILATFGVIAVGNYLAWGNIKYKNFFNLFRPASSRRNAVKPAIKIEKDTDNSIILECTGIPIVDLVTPEQLKLAGAKRQVAETTLEKSAEEKTEKQQTEKAIAQPEAQLYNITIKTKKRAEDITLAGVYFSSWEEEGFEVTVTREGETTPLDQSSEEYKKVVATLKTFLPSANPPKETVQDPSINAVVAKGGTIAFDDGKDPQFLEHNKEFNRALLRSVVEKAKTGYRSCFDNYFEVLEQGNRNALFNAEKKHLELLEKKKKLEKDQEAIGPKVRKRRIIAIVSVVATVLVIAAAITVIVFFPPAGIVPIIGTIIGIVSPAITVVSFVGKVISALINPVTAATATTAPAVATEVAVAGTITAAFGFVRKLWRYINGSNEKAEIKKGLEEVDKELKETEEVGKKLREEVGKKMEKNGVEKVLDAIGPNIQRTADPLKLGDIGHAGLMVLCDHLRENKIPRYKEIDLAGIPVDEESEKILLEALSQNFTITKLNGNGIKVTDNIARQLLINGYLQGIITDNDTRIAGLFGNVQTFKTAVIKKIKDKNTYEEIISFAEALEGLNPTAEKSPKEGIAERVRELRKQLSAGSSTPFKENLRKAALVSRAAVAFGDLECIKKSDTYTSYEALRSELEKHSMTLKRGGDAAQADKLDEMLEKDCEEDLIARYPSLLQPSTDKDAVMGGTSVRDQIKQLADELKSNHSLRSSEFIGTGANADAKAVVDFTCHRNLLIDALAKSDLESFIKNYSSIPADKRKEILEEMDRLKILQLITSKDSVNYIALTCENLRKLDEHEGLVILLERCFSLNDSLADARKKAELISALLKIPELFDYTDDKVKKDIKYKIYWATMPFGYGPMYKIHKDVPYYSLSQLESELQSVLTKIPEGNPYKAKLANVLRPTVLHSQNSLHL